MNQKIALIIGITGQDGSYLAEFLLSKGYSVYGLIRRTSIEHLDNIKHIKDNITLVQGDLTDQNSLNFIIKEINPNEVYNLGAQSFVPTSWNQPILTADVTALGVTRVLEAIRLNNPKIKFYQASSSEMFGKVRESPQNEKTPFYPRSPYAAAKVYAYWISKNYKESYGMFTCNGILFNHESPLRGETFVTRKITRALARISLGLQEVLYLGNLNALRDWGHAKDYVEMQWLMLQQDEPEDFCIATGVQFSVRDFVNFAWGHLDKTIRWEGKGMDEKGYDGQTGNLIVAIDPRYFRPTEVETLLGDPSKAKEKLGWEPKITLEETIHEMMENDINIAKRDSLVKEHGFKVPNFNE